VVNYKGKEYTYDQLKNGVEAECVIPHTVTKRGLVVSTSCGHTLRVTNKHLLLTDDKGYITAENLVAGEHTVLAGTEGAEMCEVTSVEAESADQQYFGLNCLHSEVTANNLQVSTFGDYHTVPAWYMYLAGNVFGIQKASDFGDFMAHQFYKVF
jgi:hypothetical protein